MGIDTRGNSCSTHYGGWRRAGGGGERGYSIGVERGGGVGRERMVGVGAVCVCDGGGGGHLELLEMSTIQHGMILYWFKIILVITHLSCALLLFFLFFYYYFVLALKGTQLNSRIGHKVTIDTGSLRVTVVCTEV